MVTNVVAFVASVAASKNAYFWCTAVATRPDTRPCIWPCAYFLKQNKGTRPCIMAVFATAQNFKKIDFELLLCFSHTRCILDNILTCYAWINQLDYFQMLYLIKWLNGLLIHETCNSCILKWIYACHSCKVDHGLSLHLEFVKMIKFITIIM